MKTFLQTKAIRREVGIPHAITSVTSDCGVELGTIQTPCILDHFSLAARCNRGVSNWHCRPITSTYAEGDRYPWVESYVCMGHEDVLFSSSSVARTPYFPEDTQGPQHGIQPPKSALSIRFPHWLRDEYVVVVVQRQCIQLFQVLYSRVSVCVYR